jgi:predicted N-acetyltransferase YhbS
MTNNDINFAVKLTGTMNWGLVKEDFRYAMSLEPEGCFVALYDSERIGLATTVNYGKVGWFGNLIVSEKHRKKGAGAQLVKHAVNYLQSKNVKTVGLYAYMDRIPFYKRIGFEHDSNFIVLKGKGFSSPPTPKLTTIREGDIQKVLSLDNLCFGASREKLLQPLLTQPDNLSYVAIEDTQILGYGMATVYEEAAELGPLVCQRERSDIAGNLLRAILTRLEGLEVSVCVHERESLILNLLMSHGFIESFRVARMFLGVPTVSDCIYIAESLERG